MAADHRIPLNPTKVSSSFSRGRYAASSFKQYIQRTMPKSKALVAPMKIDGIYEHGQTLMDAIFMAYSHHLHLVLTPDDIWLSLLVSINKYMEHHAEAVRSKFVRHADTMNLSIVTDDKMEQQNWPRIIAQFEQLIDQNLVPGMVDRLMPNFSTTTEHRKTIARILLMGVVKEYFNYRVMTMCGIPSVTLEGTLDDWIALKDQVQFLGTICEDFQNWVLILNPILDSFLQTYRREPDIGWWNSAVHYESMSGRNDISGWILAFFPFDSKGRWHLNSMETIQSTGEYGKVDPNSIRSWFDSVQVPVKFVEFDRTYDLIFHAEARQCRLSCLPEDRSDYLIRPHFDFAVIYIPSSKEKLSIDKITSSHHKHPLKYYSFPDGSRYCDVCQSKQIDAALSCDSCGFDLCLTCHTK